MVDIAILESLDPEFARTLVEQLALYFSSTSSLLNRLHFDDAQRLVTRVNWMDDGYVRIRDAQDTSLSIVEILRHITWTSLSLAQLGATTAQPGESPPPSIVAVGGFDGSLTRMLRTDPEGRLQVSMFDVPLSALWRLVRWGRDVDPFWVHGAEVTAPAAGTALVSKSVSAGRTGYIYGFFISSGEPNDFRINWTSGGTAYSTRIVFPGKGSLQYVDFIPLNEGLPADPGTTISITNVNAGSTGVVYQARLLYVEL